MRIQHNIAALNAYRNLTNNNSAVSKNLEKLSSGYRINRAGDDAAGLAISEKMRAQITGLNTAQKNAQDGISLVQTAEGAMTEVHSMLNRMVELANQSANGTYQDAPDRDNLEKELIALRDEIDRIADSTNFNGINLLNGDLESTVTTEGVKGGIEVDGTLADVAIDHIADGALGKDSKKGIYELDLSSLVIENNGEASATSTNKADVTDATAYTVTQTDGKAAASNGGTQVKASFNFDLDGAALTAKRKDDADTTSEVLKGQTAKLTVAGTDFEFDVSGDMTDEAIAKQLDGKTVEIGGHTFTAAVTGSAVTFTCEDDADIDLTTTPPTVALAAEKGAADKVSVEIEMSGVDTTQKLEADVDLWGGESIDGTKLADAIAKKYENGITIGGEEFEVKASSGKLTFTMKNNPSGEFTADFGATLKVVDKNGTALNPGTAGEDFDGSDIFINQAEAIGVTVKQEAIYGGKQAYAQGSFDLAALDLADGTILKIGDTEYTFAVGKDSKFAKADGKVVNLTDVEADNPNLADIAARRLSLVADDNKMFKVETNHTDGTVLLTEKANSGISYEDYPLEGSTAADRNDGGANGWKDLVQVGKAKVVEAVEEVKEGGLILQIGDTSDDFNKLTVSVKDMHAEKMGIGDISIKDQDSAAAAVDKIKDAINYVSSTRGDLGAIQNRLEHTINNLSVAAENMTAAESRIRDVDMAEEMMAYTKNNILVQAAQAMLAQANQVPQGVLQLLQ